MTGNQETATILPDPATEIEVSVDLYLQASRKLETVNRRMRELRKAYRLLSEAWDFFEVRDGTLMLEPCIRRQFSSMRVELDSILGAECLAALFREKEVLECEFRECTVHLRSVAPHLDH